MLNQTFLARRGMLALSGCATAEQCMVPNRLMRRLVGVAGVWILVGMVAVMTPVGTDDADHRDLLLHPILPHLHIENGHVVLHAPHAAKPSQTLPPRKPGPALGAASGGDGVAFGLALMPPLPGLEALWVVPCGADRLLDEDQVAPRGLAEAPPDPPPHALHLTPRF